MFCYNCGNEVENDAVFCGSCGAKLNGSEEKSTFNNVNQESSSKASSDSIKIEIDVENIKNKFKSSADGIVNSGVFNTLIELFKRPLTKGLEIIESSSVKDILILGLVFLGIGLVSLIISYLGVSQSLFGMDIGYFVRMLFGKLIISFILLYVVNIGIATLITSLFLKAGNSEDVMRKALAITIITNGVTITISVVTALLVHISVVISCILSIIGLLVSLNLYFTMFMENINVSRDIKLVLPVIAVILYVAIIGFVGVEFISRQALSGIEEIINMYNFL